MGIFVRGMDVRHELLQTLIQQLRGSGWKQNLCFVTEPDNLLIDPKHTLDLRFSAHYFEI